MGARQKLNQSYFNGSLFLAALVGLLAQSWLVFFLVLFVLLGFILYLREIRLRRQNKERPGEKGHQSANTRGEKVKNRGPPPALIGSALIVAVLTLAVHQILSGRSGGSAQALLPVHVLPISARHGRGRRHHECRT